MKTLLLPLLTFSLAATAQEPHADSQAARKIQEEIAPFFFPPVEFEERYGEYRSPLNFYDGREVKTQRDWKKRRKEILDR